VAVYKILLYYAFTPLADPETFSDSELRTRLERIIGWYEVASSECRVVTA
jgi:hypothetical protein